jgi:hypothetical protein
LDDAMASTTRQIQRKGRSPSWPGFLPVLWGEGAPDDDTLIADPLRLTWSEICGRPDCQGRWVALHGANYDESTGKATEGDLVDIDDDLATLCTRVEASAWKNCAILFCTANRPD